MPASEVISDRKSKESIQANLGPWLISWIYPMGSNHLGASIPWMQAFNVIILVMKVPSANMKTEWYSRLFWVCFICLNVYKTAFECLIFTSHRFNSRWADFNTHLFIFLCSLPTIINPHAKGQKPQCKACLVGVVAHLRISGIHHVFFTLQKRTSSLITRKRKVTSYIVLENSYRVVKVWFWSHHIPPFFRVYCRHLLRLCFLSSSAVPIEP